MRFRRSLVRIRWPNEDSVGWRGKGDYLRPHEELRRHARAQQANFISNPLWSIFNTRHLVTAHPLGGCPLGEDYLHGAADEFGRVFFGRRQRPRWTAVPTAP